MAVSRGPQRSADHANGSTARKASALLLPVCPISGLKAISPTATAMITAMLVSNILSRPKLRASASAQRTMTGVMTSAPTASRNHHVAQGAAAFAQSTDPVRPRLPTPMVAPIIALSPRLTSANLATPAGVSKVLRPSDQTLITKPPTSASIVLAAAIAAEIKIELASVASTGSASMPAANAATKMAGQTRSPRRSTAARAKGCASPPATDKIRLG